MLRNQSGKYTFFMMGKASVADFLIVRVSNKGSLNLMNAEVPLQVPSPEGCESVY